VQNKIKAVVLIGAIPVLVLAMLFYIGGFMALVSVIIGCFIGWFMTPIFNYLIDKGLSLRDKEYNNGY
jgi:hypothetical protein